MSELIGRCSRTQLAALILAVLLSAALIAPQIAPSSAADSASIAKKKKKKKKKCKSGYVKKTVNGKKKCVKKVKKGAESSTAESVSLTDVSLSPYGATLTGTLKLKKPVASIGATVYFSRCALERSRAGQITSDNAALSVDFKVKSAPLIGGPRIPCKKDYEFWVVVDGVKSNVVVK